MAIASSAAESQTKKKRKTAHLGKRVDEVMKMGADDPELGHPGSGSVDSKQPQQINSGDPVSGDPGSSSKNGKTCHQCRQKTVHFAAACKNIKKNKQCVIKLCCKCLFNRYGEKAEEVALLDDWQCPKCRGICNCSFCMRKRGQKPTGMLVHTVKASGFSSVSEMINAKGTEFLNKIISAEKIPASVEDDVAASLLQIWKENHFDQLCDAALEPMEIDDTEKDEEPKEVEIVLPHGTELTNVAEVDLPAEDVGNALQFIEFCCTFGEILNIKKGQAESILYDIMAGRSRPGKTSSLIQFQIQLLTLIKDLGEKSPLSPTDGKRVWLHVLKKYITDAAWVPKKLPALDFETNEGYYTLGSSEKLRLLVFLCDETLETMLLRNWIEEQNLKFLEEKKEVRGKLLAAKEKEKLFKKQLQDEVVKTTTAENGSYLSIAEHKVMVSELKAESERAHAEILETTALLPRYERKSDVLRTEHVFIDTKGRVLWSLKGCNKSDLLLQDISSSDEEKLDEKWFSFDEEELKVIDEQISLHSTSTSTSTNTHIGVKRQRRRKASVSAPSLTHTPAPAPAPAEALTEAPAEALTPTPDMEHVNVNPGIDLNEIPDSSLSDADEGMFDFVLL